MRAFLLNPTYRVVDGVPEIHLHGVLESGEPCLIADDRVRPFFFVRAADRGRVESLAPSATLEETDRRTFSGEPVVRVTTALPSEVPPLRQRLEAAGARCFEADVRFAYRYLIDRGLRGSFLVDGHRERHGTTGWVYRNPRLQPCQWVPRLKVLSIDIETSPAADRIYALALHTADFRRVLLVSDRPVDHAESLPSERALIRRFLGYLGALDPDVITGWNVVDFDLAVLARIARQHGVRFCIGRTEDEFEHRREASFAFESRAVVYGRLVLDGIALMRGAFLRLPDYRLETAAREFLGRGKLLAGPHRAHEIDRLYREDPQALVAYNLEDARLVSDILERTGLVDLAIQRSLLTGMPLDRVGAAVASVDSLYLSALATRGLVAPSVGGAAAESPILGGHVIDPEPGLYRNILVFDFKSLYPSILRTFNLDPLTLARSGNGDLLVAPNGARFRRDVRGVFPELVERLAAEREEARRAGHTVKANAIKILMNSLYGVLGSAASRLFSPEVANAVTHFGRELICFAADAARGRGFRVIYGDTDSLFVDSATPDPQAALAVAEELRAGVGAAVAAMVRQRYGCESFLELEFEKLYRRFFLPEGRGGKTASKKRYAGLLVDAGGAERIEFVGLEAVRRDWTELSKKFQRELLDLVFHDRPVEPFVRDFVARLRAGQLDDALVYRKALRKELNGYTRTTPQHVQAARKQHEFSGHLVEYVITRNGPEPVGEESSAYDYSHYIEHQIKPVAESILGFIGADFSTLVGAPKQLKLF